MIKDFSIGESSPQTQQQLLEEQAQRVWDRTNEMLQRGSRNFFRRSVLRTLNENGNSSIDIRDILQMVRPLLSEKDKGENGGWEFVNNEQLVSRATSSNRTNTRASIPTHCGRASSG